MKKKKIGKLYGRPLVEGDPNCINNKDILIKKEDNFITLAERKKGRLQTLSNVSTTGKNYGMFKLAMETSSVPSVVKVTSVYNPCTLKEAFFTLSTLCMVDSESAIAVDEELSDSIEILYTSGARLDKDVWLDKETIKNLIKENMVDTASELTLEFPGLKYFTPIICITFPFASFKDGLLKEVGSTKNSYRMEEGWVYDIYFSSINYKGDTVTDKFDIAGYEKSKAMDKATDESYIVVTSPILILSPLVNGVFVIGKLAGTTDIVLINCMQMDTKFMREMLGLPESVIIPCKEGEYIKYPNIYTPNTKEKSLSSIEDTIKENKQVLLNILEKKVAQLKESINSASQETDTQQ